jgi:hypothetical protein
MKRLFLTLTMTALFSSVIFAADSPGEYFSKSNSANTTKVDHSIFGDLLNLYLDDTNGSGINRFNYSAMSAGDLRQLGNYLRAMEKIKVTSLSKNEQMAFWINLYNAVTLKVILDNYPLDSIRDISSGFFSSGPWKLKLIAVEGYELTLNQIEHEILRPIWRDKRIHYAVNCASLGCPNLQSIPFTGENFDEMLEKSANEYINHKRGVNVDGNTLRLSSIYKWYDEDFGTKQNLLEHLAEYSTGSKQETLLNWKGSIKYDYNWNLNE